MVRNTSVSSSVQLSRVPAWNELKLYGVGRFTHVEFTRALPFPPCRPAHWRLMPVAQGRAGCQAPLALGAACWSGTPYQRAGLDRAGAWRTRAKCLARWRGSNRVWGTSCGHRCQISDRSIRNGTGTINSIAWNAPGIQAMIRASDSCHFRQDRSHATLRLGVQGINRGTGEI